MSCLQCQGIEEVFSQKHVQQELSRYREKGPSKTTRWLTQAIQAEGVAGETLLDIGGGVGAVQQALVDAGVAQVTGVDASSAYQQAAVSEARRRGYFERVSYHHGNFVELADEIPPADIVTLDRVICCYPDMPALVSLSAARARHVYGVVYPRDVWWIRLGLKLANFIQNLRRSSFHIFSHPTREVEALLQRYGFTRRFYRHGLFWQVAVYSRGETA